MQRTEEHVDILIFWLAPRKNLLNLPCRAFSIVAVLLLADIKIGQKAREWVLQGQRTESAKRGPRANRTS